MSLSNNTRRIVILFYIIALVFLYWFKPLFLAEPGTLGITEGIAEPILYYFFPSIKIRIIVAAIIVFIFSLLMYGLNKKHNILKIKPVLFPLVLIILLGAFHHSYVLTGAHVALLLMAFSLEKVLSLFKAEDDFADVFFVSFFMSVGALFYAKSLVFIVPITLSLYLMKSVTWRDTLVYLSGLIFPYLVASAYFWFAKQSLFYPFQFILEAFTPKTEIVFKFNIWDYVFISYVIFLTLLELYMAITKIQDGINVKAVTNKTMFTWFLVIVLAIYIIIPNINPIFVTLPLGLFISNLLSRFKNLWISSILLILLMALTLLRGMFSYNIHVV